ncbi:unnamed protein product [Strongylus vulgaris]|uniref:Uncharacterized protein n=1 Tax=Strongylus vulgaris TaxID=40348 RepID=A0A3P7ILT7_STRVU|nr:unnamed protein product [Strongylus vulgaris]
MTSYDVIIIGKKGAGANLARHWLAVRCDTGDSIDKRCRWLRFRSRLHCRRRFRRRAKDVITDCMEVKICTQDVVSSPVFG